MISFTSEDIDVIVNPEEKMEPDFSLCMEIADEMKHNYDQYFKKNKRSNYCNFEKYEEFRIQAEAKNRVLSRNIGEKL